uniref:NADH dehydrogenase subunit 4L n=1 Tax=Trichuris sp. TTB2 TaxID=1719122 RepID=A0A0M3UM03_9BILA|nr:NADH dehydrogenase subunit 4L [Trichuris sp. TTB2]
MNFNLLFFTVALTKMMFNSKHLLTMFICLELITLSVIISSWQVTWSQAMWFMAVTVIHSVFGMLLLLLTMRQLGSDKSTNLI